MTRKYRLNRLPKDARNERRAVACVGVQRKGYGSVQERRCRRDSQIIGRDWEVRDRLKAVRRFFEDYKALENKKVKVERFMGRIDACNIIESSIKLYADMKPELTGKY